MTNIDSRIVGIWRMVGTKGADDSGKALPPPYGPKAMGLATFQADGRMMAVLLRPQLSETSMVVRSPS